MLLFSKSDIACVDTSFLEAEAESINKVTGEKRPKGEGEVVNLNKPRSFRKTLCVFS